MKLTSTAKFNSDNGKPLVLLSPLDWGLGHTTRCIPIIQELIYNESDVWVACNSQQKTLLQAEFPGLNYLLLEGYGVRYARNRWITIGSLMFQIPSLLKRVRKEHQWLTEFTATHKVDAIISDNRFGFFAPGIPSVFITHQLAIKTGLGSWLDSQARTINYRWINKFSEVWVPDNETGYSIAGRLSKPGKMPDPPVKYIGGISRLENCPEQNYDSDNLIDLLIILSGPEPQRSVFEKILLDQLPAINKRNVVLVRALPGAKVEMEKILPGIICYNHVPAKELNSMICRAKMVISRSGYTTVMDLLKTKKKSILVPTPGQAEQEYLATYLQKERLACTASQYNFQLQEILRKAESFPYVFIDDGMQQYKAVISRFVKSLRQ